MSVLLSALLCLSAPVSVKLDPVPFTQVTINDRFWSRRQETNRTATVDQCLKMLDKAGNFLVMELARDKKREGYKGLLFTDSDLYKVLEGISYTLQTSPNPALDKRMDEIIALIGSAQMPDGYINTWFQVTRPEDKFKNLRDWHELYCAGHMIEAAVAHFQATKKRSFLDIVLKYANLINSKFGPGGTVAYCGHPEIELALVKLWKVTGDRKWFELSKRMVENRGAHYFAQEHKTPDKDYDGTYWLDDMPIREHRDIKGHAVRAAYLMSGAADVARETDDPGMIKMLDRMWRSTVERRIFVTGGIGPSGSNEGFTVDYDLPNETAYQETCASIAMALWGQRMALLHADAQYADAVEMSLYNGVLSGISLDGRSFFYTNPLASRGTHHRSEWFQCACCPPNVLRTIASVGGYAYATSSDALYVNLYIGGSVKARVGEKELAFDVKTDYPWNGDVELKAKTAGTYTLMLRKPRWSDNEALSVRGSQVDLKTINGYFKIERTWQAGDVVKLILPMKPTQIEANPMVKSNLGRTAVQRGPLIYCAEQVDNDFPIQEAVLPAGSLMNAQYRDDVLGGVVTIDAEGIRTSPNDWDRKLYQPTSKSTIARVRFVPYGFWDNRKPGRMDVWLPSTPPPAKVVGLEGKADVSVSYRSGNAQIYGINDGIEPTASNEQPNALCHFWPHKGGDEWVQYTWKSPQAISGIKLYWFDDTGRGECRIPASWKLQALVNGSFADVPLKEYPLVLNKWNEVSFPSISTTALRVLVKQKEGWSSGIHEWKIVRTDD